MSETSPTMFKRILIAIDGSKPSEWAAQAGRQLAEQLGGCLLLVYVVENSVPISTDYVTIECAETIRREQATALLERTRLLMPDTLQVDTLVCSGYAAEEIVEAGIAWRADLIMIGTRGRGRLAHFVLGSTADAIIRHARCPVVSVGHEPSHPPAQWGGIVSDLTVATTPHSASGGEC